MQGPPFAPQPSSGLRGHERRVTDGTVASIASAYVGVLCFRPRTHRIAGTRSSRHTIPRIVCCLCCMRPPLSGTYDLGPKDLSKNNWSAYG